jgi:aldose 1-epimerase
MAETPQPLTGTQHDISAGDYHATITELGANLRTLRYRDIALISGYEADEVPPAGAGELLVPWPNRIDHGRYSFAGQDLQLDLSEPATGNAIHGLTRWASWSLVEIAQGSVELGLRLPGRPGYPFFLDLRARYGLSAAGGLTVTISARNAGSHSAPYGTGSHPYLRAGGGLVDDWTLELPASRWLPADEHGIPSGEPRDVTGTDCDFRAARPIGGASLDHALTDLTRDPDGKAWARLAGDEGPVALWAGPGYGWLQVFTGDTLGPDRSRRALAVEPMTCPPNAFATGTDLITIAPGASVRHQWGVQAARS